MARALYDRPGPYERRVIVIAYAYADAAEAAAQFAVIEDAYRVMPIAALLANPLTLGDPQGQPAANVETAAGPELGDDRRAFRTARPDGGGANVWSDIYRFEQIVAVVQVIERDAEAASALREQVAQRIAVEAGS